MLESMKYCCSWFKAEELTLDVRFTCSSVSVLKKKNKRVWREFPLSTFMETLMLLAVCKTNVDKKESVCMLNSKQTNKK